MTADGKRLRNELEKRPKSSKAVKRTKEFFVCCSGAPKWCLDCGLDHSDHAAVAAASDKPISQRKNPLLDLAGSHESYWKRVEVD